MIRNDGYILYEDPDLTMSGPIPPHDSLVLLFPQRDIDATKYEWIANVRIQGGDRKSGQSMFVAADPGAYSFEVTTSQVRVTPAVSLDVEDIVEVHGHLRGDHTLLKEELSGLTQVITFERDLGDTTDLSSLDWILYNWDKTTREYVRVDDSTYSVVKAADQVEFTLNGAVTSWVSARALGYVDAGGGSGGTGGSGWIYVYDAETQGAGVVSNKAYQDAGDNVLQSATTSDDDLVIKVRSSYPLVKIGTTTYQLTLSTDSGHYTGDLNHTISGTGPVVVTAQTPDDEDGAQDTVVFTLDAPPEILTLSFTGGYPGSQTELKAGDTFQITGTTDKPATGVRILNYEACQLSEPTFASATNFTVTCTIADRGDVATLRPARVQAKDASGAYGSTRDTNQGGGSVDGTDVVNLNNLHPTVVIGTITYPATQSALKGSESATVAMTTANLDTISYTSPTSELSITNPTTDETPKTVTRIAGTYNDSTNNYQATANRAANDATTTARTVVDIAAAAATIQVSEPASRLRLGASYSITLTSDQTLDTAPQLDEDSPNAGTFSGVWSGGPSTWTRSLGVADSDVPGTYTWQNLSVTNRAGLSTTTITGDATYVLGGFTARTVTFPPFSQTTTLALPVTDYSKLQAGIFTATNQQSIKNPTLGNTDDLLNTYTITATGVNPTTIFWNDFAAANSNSSGTAQLIDIEELP